ncbi:ribosomal protein S18-alanine N-acetyltransferase [Enterococcus sp. BWB1-3]|uniref:ribosomal protein S18-alanine N-acetyltransferase n=1 Tax=unclassified Enterococcus TaxID=2608891 RepID=UPI001921AD11|nr:MULTISPECIES: ribosomal protein S18-alanine N-acetyltransferase [unclassified Enterococcus]MBL1230484.1 ribosomal protein S18-alanine N-acetyltransferase [Enterococcus sp. BWB1-3]MCB5950864.1 ribosomal protein S18-alanine N-acetyltransferase [Enterococcus sp. BWT-B8]MCB5955305.1 ribosomal protein S18-alanine N-acetyltransferase [Enterococcus sp. CWB-B31]
MLKKFNFIEKLFGKKELPKEYESAVIAIGNNEYFVREITQDDIKDLLMIEREVYEGEVPWTRSAFLNELHSKNPHLYILVQKEGKTVGFIGCRVIEADGHITNVAVAKKEQGKGIAVYLLKEAIAFSKNHQCTNMSLEVRLSNKHAQGIYRKLGFSSNKITEGYYDDGEHALEMKMDL